MVRIRKITMYRFSLNGSHLQVEFLSQLLAIHTNFRLAFQNEKANSREADATCLETCVSSVSKV